MTSGRVIHDTPSSTGRSRLTATEAHRRGGLRVRILTADGRVLYDTHDCYHAADAISRAEQWAAEHQEEL